LSWPASLSSSDSVDRDADRLGQAPLTQAAANQLGEFLGGEIARRLATLDPSVASSTSSRSSELADYLTKLNVRVEVAPASVGDRQHVDHILRTAASFSLTGEQPNISDDEVNALLASRTCMLVKVADRVSEYGPSGVVVARVADNAFVVESVALSCPVLGKQVEFAILSALAQIANARRCDQILFEYRPSERNQPALAFLKAIADEEPGQRYVLNITDAEARINQAAVAPGAWNLQVSPGEFAAG
jgi:predicted enzyme involved in methoxymalonyl-ACP biosynthesis